MFKPNIGRTALLSTALVVGLIAGTVGFNHAKADTLSDQNKAPVYKKNAGGQTYGSALYAPSPELEPDLIQAEDENGTVGYVLKTELDGPIPKTLEEATELMRKTPKVRKINLYASDGKTVIGTFKIEQGHEIYVSDDN